MQHRTPLAAALGLDHPIVRAPMAGGATTPELPAYPVQNALTAELRQAAARQGRADYLSLWAGQGAGLARSLPAAELVSTLADELAAARGGG